METTKSEKLEAIPQVSFKKSECSVFTVVFLPQLYLSNNLIPHLLYVGDHSCLTKSTFVEEFLSLIMPNHMDLGVSGLWATRVYVMYAVECVSQ